jgi:hypothetical protein
MTEIFDSNSSKKKLIVITSGKGVSEKQQPRLISAQQ